MPSLGHICSNKLSLPLSSDDLFLILGCLRLFLLGCLRCFFLSLSLSFSDSYEVEDCFTVLFCLSFGVMSFGLSASAAALALATATPFLQSGRPSVPILSETHMIKYF
jgi:hypothetical protein